jgi:acyl-CoA synthetase (AMP-forming)/AMP-acid ligase II
MTHLHHLLAPSLAKPGTVLQTIDGTALDTHTLKWEAERVASALGAEGVCKNEPVLLMTGNEPRDLVGFLGIWEAGAVAVPCHANTPELAVEAMRNRVGCRFAVSQGIVRTAGTNPPPGRPELDGAALIVFTSGSTGQPKGVIVSHGALCWKLGVLSELLAFREDDVILCPLQLTFIFGVWVTLLGLLAGARTVLVPKFSAVQLVRALEHATILAAVPSMLRMLTEQPPSAAGLKKVLTGGEPLGAALARRIGARFPGTGIFDLYGSTETGSCDFCLAPADQPSGLGTIGRPTKGVSFRVAAVPGYALPNEGELQIKTPSRMTGYLDGPGQTSNALPEGYFRTGDLARLREDGFVELIGRIKDIISRGGIKIAPLEIDALFAQHPDILSALTTGVPDPILGETVHVLAVRREGSSITASELREWLSRRVEKFKIPDMIHFVEALPAGATGKADRRAAAQFIMTKGAVERTG